MNNDIIKISTPDGDFYISAKGFNAEDKKDPFVSNSVTEKLKEFAVDALDAVLSPMKIMSNAVIKTTDGFSRKPEEIELEMNISFGIKSGQIISVITEGEAKADIKVVFKWKNVN